MVVMPSTIADQAGHHKSIAHERICKPAVTVTPSANPSADNVVAVNM